MRGSDGPFENRHATKKTAGDLPAVFFDPDAR
jgi:hypothetical protein